MSSLELFDSAVLAAWSLLIISTILCHDSLTCCQSYQRYETVDNKWCRGSNIRLGALVEGARILHAPQTHVYGESQATLQDFAGQIWTHTQTVKNVDPTAWGGEAVDV